jgi:hypothetical protein
LEAENIDQTTYEILNKKQKQSDATEEEKLIIEKHVNKLRFGADKLDENILRQITKSKISNFISLIDESNLISNAENQDNRNKEQFIKVRLIKKLIEDIGYKNMFDTKTRIPQSTNLISLIDTNVLFTNFNDTKIMFNLDKHKSEKDFSNNKQFLGFVNSLLSDYGLKIYSNPFRNKSGQFKRFYQLAELHNINEIIEMKIQRGFKLKDTLNIRKQVQIVNYKRNLNSDRCYFTNLKIYNEMIVNQFNNILLPDHINRRQVSQYKDLLEHDDEPTIQQDLNDHKYNNIKAPDHKRYTKRLIKQYVKHINIFE